MAKIKSRFFSEIEYQDNDVIFFPEGIPGFEELNYYIILDIEEFKPFRLLLSVNEPVICFPIISPILIDSGYNPGLIKDDLRILGMENYDEFALFVIATIGRNEKEVTANLKAPLCINVNKRIGRQAIVDNNYSVKHPIIFNTVIQTVDHRHQT